MVRTPLHIIIERLTERLAPVVRNAFMQSIADISDNVILKDLIAAIEANDYQRAFRVLGMTEAAMRPLTAALASTFETGGITVANTFPRVVMNGVRGIFRFDMRNTQAEDWLRQQSSSLVTRVQEDTRVNIMNILETGTREGNNPRTTALDIVGRIDPITQRRTGGIIGLAQNQEQWVSNARVDLMTGNYENYLRRVQRDKRFDSVVRAAMKSGEPLSQSEIDKLIIRYKDKLLKMRGEAIGRTETVQALNRSQFETMRQAIDIGSIKRADAFKVWDTAGDARVRESHKLMDGQRVQIDEPFVTPDGERLMHPGDISLGASAGEIIHCRCRIKWDIDFLSDID